MTDKTKTFVIAVVVLVFLSSAGHVVMGTTTAAAGDSGDAWEQFQQCKIDCNQIYGGVDVLPPPASSSGTSLGWANCVLACERKYWKQFDKEMESDK
jgi:hypothetical protein